jgi:hypothetical protein
MISREPERLELILKKLSPEGLANNRSWIPQSDRTAVCILSGNKTEKERITWE